MLILLKISNRFTFRGGGQNQLIKRLTLPLLSIIRGSSGLFLSKGRWGSLTSLLALFLDYLNRRHISQLYSYSGLSNSFSKKRCQDLQFLIQIAYLSLFLQYLQLIAASGLRLFKYFIQAQQCIYRRFIQSLLHLSFAYRLSLVFQQLFYSTFNIIVWISFKH